MAENQEAVVRSHPSPFLRASSNGRTRDYGSRNEGSSPSARISRDGSAGRVPPLKYWLERGFRQDRAARGPRDPSREIRRTTTTTSGELAERSMRPPGTREAATRRPAGSNPALSFRGRRGREERPPFPKRANAGATPAASIRLAPRESLRVSRGGSLMAEPTPNRSMGESNALSKCRARSGRTRVEGPQQVVRTADPSREFRVCTE